MDDAELLGRWRRGDEASGHALVERHFGVVHRFFRSKLDADAEDLAQRTFVACLQARDRADGIRSFRAYALGIARNVLFDHYRREQRSARVGDFMTVSADQIATSLSQVVADREEHKLLLVGLRSLPLDLQITLELFYWEDMTQVEIGSVLGIPEGTVKSRLNRARGMLRKRVEAAATSSSVLASTMDGFESWTRSLRVLFGGEDEHGKASTESPKPNEGE